MEIELIGILEFRTFIEHTLLVKLRQLRSHRANEAVFELVQGVVGRVEVGAELVLPVAVHYAVDDVTFKRHNIIRAV